MSSCERVTAPPPEPMAQLVERLMQPEVAATREPQSSGIHARPAPPARQPILAPRPGPRPERGAEAPSIEEASMEDMPPSAQADLVVELLAVYVDRLGSRAHVPRVVATLDKARGLPLDHWAGYVLSLIDGATSIEEILDAAPIPEHDVLRLLFDLAEHGVIALDAPKG